MASFEEKLELLEHALTRVTQAQDQGQARLEQALKRVEGLIPGAGEAVASAMAASADQAAQAHLAALMRVAEEVATASRGTVAEASKAVQELRQSIQAEVQASQGVLRAVNVEADKASTLLRKMGEQGTQGEETLKAIHAELVGMRESVGAHKVQLKEAIKQAEAQAVEELGALRERVQDLLPGYLLWLREWFSIGVMAGLLLLAFFGAKFYVERTTAAEIRAEIVQEMVPVARVYTAHKTTTSAGERGAELKWNNLSAPLLDLGNGLYGTMKFNGEAWVLPDFPGPVWPKLPTATIYRDKTLQRRLDE